MLKRVITVIAALMISVTITACGSKQSPSEDKSTLNRDTAADKITIAVSFYPLKELVEAVGGDKVAIKVIVPEGSEPHDFEPKPRDMENINTSKIFVYNGLGMESWVEKTLDVLNNKNLQVVEASKGTNLIKSDDGKSDPHIWLSLKESQIEASNIRDALVKADPSNKQYYDKNLETFSQELNKVNEEYYSKFNTLKNKNFVTGHAAFAYLCRDFGLKQNSVEDIFAEGEPTPKKIKDLVDYCRQNSIKVVFMEELASPKVSETLAKEVGAKVEKIYTIESKEEDKNYIQIMHENLEKIYNSLK